MSRWAVFSERGAPFVGFVEAPDRDRAIAAAIGKFDEVVQGFVHVQPAADVPRDIPIEPTKIRRFDVVPPANEKPTPEEMLDNTPTPLGEEEWRDGPQDDGSVESDDILPDR